MESKKPKKQTKLIEEEEEIECIDSPIEKNSELDDHHLEDFQQDYRSLKSSVDYNDEEYRHLNALNEKIYEVFNKSRWAALNPDRKIPKDLIPFIFQEMFDSMSGTEFTMVEKFVAVCDFIKYSYAKAYELIHMKYKEEIVTEMDQKYAILSKKRIKKIF